MQSENTKIEQLLFKQKVQASALEEREKKIRQEFIAFFLFTLLVFLVGYYGEKGNGFPLWRHTKHYLEMTGEHIIVLLSAVVLSLAAASIFVRPQVKEKNLNLAVSREIYRQVEKIKQEEEI